jgi:large subunit ribosomal protein L23
MKKLQNVILKPLITEKNSLLTEVNNVYGFKVDLKSNKNQIRSAIEKYFNVKVTEVKTAVMPGRMKKQGKHTTKTNKWKKAYVSIADGQKIELFRDI